MTKLFKVISSIAFIGLPLMSKCYNLPESPKRIVIAGKIDHYKSEGDISISVMRLGFDNEEVFAKIDSLGNFFAEFESFIPTDTWITFKTNFLVNIRPGDSLYIHFDGSARDRPDVLKTVRFGGNSSITNQHIATLQQMFFEHPLSTDDTVHRKKIKDYNPPSYLRYLDTVRTALDKLYDDFVSNNAPNEESKKWSLLFLKHQYDDLLAFYPREHRAANHMTLQDSWDVPKGFFQPLANGLPIDTSMLSNGYALNGFADRYDMYIADELKGNTEQGVGVNAGFIFAPTDIFDSLLVYSTINHVSDTLLRQIMLTSFFSRQLKKQDVSCFEKYESLIERYINLPFLKVPLYEIYLQTKDRTENPAQYTYTTLNELSLTETGTFLQDIISSNKNKIIYIDFWATWCGPCLAEMPNAKLLEQEMKNKEVVFIYVCIDSDKDKWKAVVDKYKLNGYQYFLARKESKDIQNVFKMSGIPYYILINKDGIIKEQGNHLRPTNVKEKLTNLF